MERVVDIMTWKLKVDLLGSSFAILYPAFINSYKGIRAVLQLKKCRLVEKS